LEQSFGALNSQLVEKLRTASRSGWMKWKQHAPPGPPFFCRVQRYREEKQHPVLSPLGKDVVIVLHFIMESCLLGIRKWRSKSLHKERIAPIDSP
jgi:hypothetical protein